jgi:ABC-type Fe3+ transport system substrate-binding protein
LTKNEADAEDLVAEAITRAWRARASLTDPVAFRAWIFRILTNTFISERRKTLARPREELLIDESSEGEGGFSIFERLHQPFLLWFANPEREFLDKLADQEISVQDMAPAALINLVVSGEIPLSPTIFDANVTLAKQKGAPVEWRPLEPVVTTVGSAALLAKASNPHTALLFIDYLLSKEGQQLIMKGGLWSPREDVGSVEQKFKKNYLDEKYSSEEMEVKLGQWENLLRQLFLRRR